MSVYTYTHIRTYITYIICDIHTYIYIYLLVQTHIPVSTDPFPVMFLSPVNLSVYAEGNEKEMKRCDIPSPKLGNVLSFNDLSSLLNPQQLYFEIIEICARYRVPWNIENTVVHINILYTGICWTSQNNFW